MNLRLYALNLLFVVLAFATVAQEKPFSTFYYQRASLFEKLPVDSTDIIFLGNSITNGAEWNELFPDKHVKNRGISGDRTTGLYDRLNAILPGQPKKIFLLIGINDLQHGASVDSVVHGIIRIAERVKTESPNTTLFIQSILPVNDQFGKFPNHTNKGPEIIEINKHIKRYCLENKLTFIDLYKYFKNKDDEKMNPEYTNDGLHLMGDGYLIWIKVVQDYIETKKERR
ncbi:GDSL-type esterase/lipase family protein [Maribellus sediminis]|uniref:GDSL-type esterase/lipase family protein n=1 Tax=Maribellus sediminis TaxID=2696285 RepID=UPI00142F5265|nr:GDSL-type esterase/lipase family protein [Maribellus sediminis]